MPKRKFEEIVSDLREQGADDLAEELERDYGTTSLKTEAAKAGEFERQLSEANAKIAKLERAPQLRKAFTDYGLDFEGLRPAERRMVEQYEGELDAEKIGEFVEQFELPIVQQGGDQQQTDQQPPTGARRQAQTATAAPAGGRGAAGLQITPDDVAGWTAEKWLRFRNEHGEAAQLILQGKTVTGVAFS